ncbi:MAG: iron-sulfur cluster assembly scaffold protein [Chloroflexota bacterium]|nr:iron-sulfur cluster assembly scaffold protein [Chloroflexota bacterium]
MTRTEYSLEVIDHYSHPRNPGALPDATGRGQSGQGTGGELLIQIAIRAKNGVVEEARFRAFGCSASIASASMATELLAGRTLPRALELGPEEIEQALGGLPASRQHCAAHAAAAARDAVQDHLAHAGSL